MIRTLIPQPDTTEERETPTQTRPATRIRRFLLTYDYSKAIKTGGISRLQKHRAEGVQFGSKRVALDYENGNTDGYPSIKAMKLALERQGNCDIEWVD